jgi:CelD/BcsL family acetyltransferase involved in cellulose biosynthesis
MADVGLQTRSVQMPTAWLGSELLAAGVVLRHGRTTYLLDTVSPGDAEVLRHRPNQALLWFAIRTAHEQGCTGFDLGPSHRANPGLSGYKQRWATSRTPVPHFFFSDRKSRLQSGELGSPLYTVARAVIRRLPPMVHAHLGTTLALEAF